MKKDIYTRELKTDVSLREEGEKRTIEGFIPYNSRSEYMGFYEYISPTAFNKTLSDGADVRALQNHDSSKLLGRVKNGSLRLNSLPDGLHIECDLPNTSYAEDVYNLIRGGYNTGLSFGFSIIQQDIGEEEIGGVREEIHTLKECRLYEVSFAVSFPAYESTNSLARNIRGIDLAGLNTVLNHDSLTEEDEGKVREYIEKLNRLLEPAEADNTRAVEDTQAVEPAPSEQFVSLMSKLDFKEFSK